MTNEEVKDRTIILNLSFGRLGTRRKVRKEDVKVQASEALQHLTGKGPDTDQDLIGVTKKILDSPELKAIEDFDRETRAYVRGYSLSMPLPAGEHCLPTSAVIKVDTYLMERARQRPILVNRLLDVYEEQVKEAETRLGPLFDPRQYPSREQVAGIFTMEFYYRTDDAPRKLEQISAEIFRREQEKIGQVWQNAGERIEQSLIKAFSDLVNHAVEQLTPIPGGRKKHFHPSNVDRILEFARTFKDRNITGNEDLRRVVEEIERLTNDLSLDDLKKNEDFRDHVRQQFEKARVALSAMIVERPKRLIISEDEAASTTPD
jgi:hypothetical protein